MLQPDEVTIWPNLFYPNTYDLFVHATRFIQAETMTIVDNVRSGLLSQFGGITECDECAQGILAELRKT